MRTQSEISFTIKTCAPETLSIFIDDNPVVDVEEGKYIWRGSSVNHKIRIEQTKIFKFRWFWGFAPIAFILSEGDAIEAFGGKTPFYLVYEAEFKIEGNITVNISLTDDSTYKEQAVYKLSVSFPEGTDISVIRNELTATKEEVKRWAAANVIFSSILFGFLIFIFAASANSGFARGGWTGFTIFLWMLTALTAAGWIFIIYKVYESAYGRLKK